MERALAAMRVERELADNFNRGGLILAFASFWFAAPEFIGERRLKSWETSLAHGLLKLPVAINWSIGIVILAGGIVLFGLIREGKFRGGLLENLGLVLYGLFALSGLAQKLIDWGVPKLASNDRARQNSLFVGGVLFTIGFLLQLISTF